MLFGNYLCSINHTKEKYCQDYNKKLYNTLINNNDFVYVREIIASEIFLISVTCKV